MRFVQPNLVLYFFLMILGISGFFVSVIWPQAEGFYAMISLAAAGGFGAAAYIYHTKSNNKELVCPVGSNCQVVTRSKYANFLGVPLEHLGMAYYALTIANYGAIIFGVQPSSGPFARTMLVLSGTAFLFSLYLLFVQAFILRQWCIWCLLSATLSIAIFIFTLASVKFAVAFLVEITSFMNAMSALGFALGMGGATAITTLLFLKFFRDRRIDDSELQILKTIAELIWLGLALVLLSQFMFYIGDAAALARSGNFLAKIVALFVAAVSGAILMIFFAPLVAVVPFKEGAPGHHSALESLRKPLFAVGAISLASWYFAFFCDYLPVKSPALLLLAYAVFLALAVITALVCEKRIREGAVSASTQPADRDRKIF